MISLHPSPLLEYQVPAADRPVLLACRDVKYFKDWLFLARSIAFFKVAPEFKRPLLCYFQEMDIAIQPAEHQNAFSHGSHTIHMSLLQEALEHVGCTAVRVQAYGMKTPLGMLDYDEPASEGHPLQRYNTFDLGRNYGNGQGNFVFFRSAYLNATPVKTLPMCLGVGQGFGSTYFRFRRAGVPLTVKCYPLWVHHFKSISVKHATTQPKTHAASRKRYKSMRRMVQSLGRIQVRGGCRVEATVQYTSLWGAVEWISKTPFLQARTYTRPPTKELYALKMDILELSQHNILEHAKDMLSKAEQTGLLIGRDAQGTSLRLAMVLKDCLNSIGWASILWKPSQWNDEGAWWKEELPEPSQPVMEDAPAAEEPHWNGNLWTVAEARAFYDANRLLLPCPKEGCHRLATTRPTGGQRQFRVSCHVCLGHTCKGDSAKYWIQLYLDKQLAIDPSTFPAMTLTRLSASPTVRAPTPQAPIHHPALMPPPIPNPYPSRRQSKRQRTTVRTPTPEAEEPESEEPEPEPEEPESEQLESEDPDSPDGSQYAGSSHSSQAAAPARTTRSGRQKVPPSQRHSRRSPTIGIVETLQGKEVEVVMGGTFFAHGRQWRFTKDFISSDGNCQFQALSFLAFGHLRSAQAVRKRVVHYMQAHKDIITQYAAEGEGHTGAAQWLKAMAKDRHWGDQISLHAAALVYGLKLAVASVLPSGDHHWTYYPTDGLPIMDYSALYHTRNHYELLVSVEAD